MASAPRPRTWTRAEYARLVDTGILGPEDRVELLDGEIIEMSPEKSRHAATIDLVAEALRQVFGAGFLVRVQHPLGLGDRSEPEPDVAVVRGSARDYVAAHPERAELVVEVSDTSLVYDRGRKAVAYARAGIPEYWIVDIVEAQLEVHREPSSSGYGSRTVLKAGDVIAPAAVPGGNLKVGDLLP